MSTRTYTKRGTPFWDRFTEAENGCREWIGGRHPKGYGYHRVDGKPIYAHRHAWELINGPIPAGMVICHRCDNPPCGNPDHLFLGTQSDNLKDMVAKGRAPRISGDQHVATKISDKDVRHLRDLHAEGFTYAQLATIFGISTSYVCRLATGDRR